MAWHGVRGGSTLLCAGQHWQIRWPLRPPRGELRVSEQLRPPRAPRPPRWPRALCFAPRRPRACCRSSPAGSPRPSGPVGYPAFVWVATFASRARCSKAGSPSRPGSSDLGIRRLSPSAGSVHVGRAGSAAARCRAISVALRGHWFRVRQGAGNARETSITGRIEQGARGRYAALRGCSLSAAERRPVHYVRDRSGIVLGVSTYRSDPTPP